MTWDALALLGKNEYEVKEDLHGKVALITGASSGLGKVSAYELAAKGCHVFLACRNEQKAESVIRDIIDKTGNRNVEFIEFIADDLESVKTCAKKFIARNLPLHILMNNAGLGGVAGLSKQGYQMTFAVNHLSHFLLTELLLPVLRRSAPARIVSLASMANILGSRYDFHSLRNPNGTFMEYSQSKLANIVHMKKLSQLLEGSGVTTYSCHPGIVATDIWRDSLLSNWLIKRLFMIDERLGARTQLFCATDPSVEGESGYYYDDCQIGYPNTIWLDQKYQDELYDESYQMIRSFLQ
jgi:NAD(P)-dependent dehydrogenase (short-subunit alcohol dehydrogenase family)